MNTSTKLASSAATVGVLANFAGAAIVSADFSSSPFTIGDTTSSIYIDFEAGTASTVSDVNQDVRLAFVSNTEKPRVEAVNSSGWAAASYTAGPYSVSFASKLSFGDSIPLSGSSTAYLEKNSSSPGSPWNTPNDGIGYLGLSKGPLQSWLRVNYNDTANTLSLLGVGYNSDGSLLAGQTAAVPEPGASAAAAALLAGGVAAYSRRRRKA